MNKIEPKTLKGFRDFLPEDARKRQYVIDKLQAVFESYGFEPLETPVLEYEEILSGKYGEEGEKLMYRFEDNGGRKVAMRYDQTVPLARVIAQYQEKLPLPFKRYQISNVFRGENPQAGRFREFTQCDIDTVGVNSLMADAEIIACAGKSLEILGFEKYKILINDRSVFNSFFISSEDIPSEKIVLVIRALDKIKKIGREAVIDEIIKTGVSKEIATEALNSLERKEKPESIQALFKYLGQLNIFKERLEFSPFLARGLDYYTSTIFEIEVEGYPSGSVCGGGRYDNLVGMFGNQTFPAVGCAFGFNRLIEAMEELNLFPKDLVTTKALILNSQELENNAIKTVQELRKAGVNTEVYLDKNTVLEKQFKYAERKKIPFVIIPKDEGTVELRSKNSEGKIEKEEVSFSALVEKLK